MRIAVVGPGAVGSFYGAKLARAGHEAHFLLRSDYEQVRRRGVQVQSPEGDFNARVKCARTPEEIGPSDLVLIALAREPTPWMVIVGVSILVTGEALRLWGVAHIGATSRTRGDEVQIHTRQSVCVSAGCVSANH